MDYYGLKSIVASEKTPIGLVANSKSFYVRSEEITSFIEPCFAKTEFPTEKPSILLVSAVAITLLVVTLGLVPSVIGKHRWVPGT